MDHFCQRCHKNIQLDGSLLDIDKVELEKVERAVGSASGTGDDLDDELNESEFVLLPMMQNLSKKSQEPEQGGDKPASFHEQVVLASRVLDIVSYETKVNLPVCVGCASLLLAEMGSATNEVRLQNSAYTHILQSSQNAQANSSSNETEEELIQETEALEREEKELTTSLQNLAQEIGSLEKQSGILKQQARALGSIEKKYWSNVCAFESMVHAERQRELALDARIELNQARLKVLESTSVYQEAFRIGSEGHFGTINGFRLGMIAKSQPVPWDEINAGWGSCVLLLDVLSKELDFVFSDYHLVPLGSFSKIQRLENNSKTDFPLYFSNDISLARLFSYRKYDAGMVAFCVCVRQLATEFKIDLPMEITASGEKIGGANIRLQMHSDSEWTQALKFLLADLKAILVWVIAQRRPA